MGNPNYPNEENVREEEKDRELQRQDSCDEDIGGEPTVILPENSNGPELPGGEKPPEDEADHREEFSAEIEEIRGGEEENGRSFCSDSGDRGQTTPSVTAELDESEADEEEPEEEPEGEGIPVVIADEGEVQGGDEEACEIIAEEAEDGESDRENAIEVELEEHEGPAEERQTAGNLNSSEEEDTAEPECSVQMVQDMEEGNGEGDTDEAQAETLVDFGVPGGSQEPDEEEGSAGSSGMLADTGALEETLAEFGRPGSSEVTEPPEEIPASEDDAAVFEQDGLIPEEDSVNGEDESYGQLEEEWLGKEEGESGEVLDQEEGIDELTDELETSEAMAGMEQEFGEQEILESSPGEEASSISGARTKCGRRLLWAGAGAVAACIVAGVILRPVWSPYVHSLVPGTRKKAESEGVKSGAVRESSPAAVYSKQTHRSDLQQSAGEVAGGAGKDGVLPKPDRAKAGLERKFRGKLGTVIALSLTGRTGEGDTEP